VSEYHEFLATKAVDTPLEGIVGDVDVSSQLFPFQVDITRWALRRGRAAIFAGCGLGKTPCQLEWSRIVSAHTGRPVLILAPLAVSQQTRREGEKFHVPVNVCRDKSDIVDGVNITNYERLDRFDPSEFSGVVLDESSILKSFSGKIKNQLQAMFADTPFRLCCTATPSPNDHLELGNHSEFLGVLASHQMLARWFLPDTSSFGTYLLKGHARRSFWDWVATWARCVGAPSDLGYCDDGFILPPLRQQIHAVQVDVTEGRDAQGTLFRMPEMSATSVHAERRRTAEDRAECVRAIVNAEPAEQWLIWVETDYDARAVSAALDGRVTEVKGPQSPEVKEAALLGFSDGVVRTLLCKPKIAGFGMNWQQCARVIFAGPGFSYESFYQAVRRTWRFGQAREVHCHVIMAATEAHVWDVVQRKAARHAEMQTEMFEAMRRAQRHEATLMSYTASEQLLPVWLKTA